MLRDHCVFGVLLLFVKDVCLPDFSQAQAHFFLGQPNSCSWLAVKDVFLTHCNFVNWNSAFQWEIISWLIPSLIAGPILLFTLGSKTSFSPKLPSGRSYVHKREAYISAAAPRMKCHGSYRRDSGIDLGIDRHSMRTRGQFLFRRAISPFMNCLHFLYQP